MNEKPEPKDAAPKCRTDEPQEEFIAPEAQPSASASEGEGTKAEPKPTPSESTLPHRTSNVER